LQQLQLCRLWCSSQALLILLLLLLLLLRAVAWTLRVPLIVPLILLRTLLNKSK
jgi:hypothetical protein